MKSVQDLANNTVKKVDDYMAENQVIGRIMELVGSLAERPVDNWGVGELISVIGELSVLKVNLGRLVAIASLEYNSAYAYRKFSLADDFFKLRNTFKSASETEKQAIINNTEAHEEQIQKNYQADVFKSLHDDVTSLVMVIQTILNSKKTEERETKYQ
jgi:hypothetical protein